MPDCTGLKVGDRCIRIIGGVPMLGYVVKVEEHLLKWSAHNTQHWPEDELWTFDRRTGVEEDEELNWGVKFNRTGSVLYPKAWTDEQLELVKKVEERKKR